MPSTVNQLYPTTEGPLGFPLTDRQAIALDAILKALPKDDAFRYRKATVARGPSELLPGERADVSWITTEDPDRTREVVRARGMNDSQFKLNPLVTLQHAYSLPPIGRSLWRKVVRDGSMHGVKAKTQYPVKPDSWQGTWPADVALCLVQADLLRGKSIGFLPTKVHAPGETERQTNGWKDVDLVIDEWILLEYACTFLPAQQNAIVEAVSKSTIQLPEEFIKAMDLDGLVLPSLTFGARQTSGAGAKGDSSSRLKGTVPLPSVSRFVPLEEIEKALLKQLNSLDLPGLANQIAQQVLDKARGRV
jgi:hypothetical protein